ncbi:hypothetical protein [Mycolicibacterium obuense]|uniref:Uncharacterized protein n=1 Tax=Mycolicibacterium obuense TaxID=1807 RepID=A0A0M2JWP1_9MYCO|nr:hypothetical protein [Mycolicibacterium obuense]KKF01497.1 hypothetical protein WN67_13175 [Mycolicibacterium obuense]
MDVPVSGGIATYRGKQYPIAFTGDNWIALRAEGGPEFPDAIEVGESRFEPGHYRPWVKVPRASIEKMLYRKVTGFLSGHAVSLVSRFHDGQIGVSFIGSPAVADELGLDGDQYMGWTGHYKPEDFDSIAEEETPYA